MCDFSLFLRLGLGLRFPGSLINVSLIYVSLICVSLICVSLICVSLIYVATFVAMVWAGLGYLFCGNRGLEAEGILARTFGHLFRGRAFRCGGNFPRRTAPSAGSAVHDNLGAIVLGSVAVDADGAAPPTEH
jgi:hypothetical protein